MKEVIILALLFSSCISLMPKTHTIRPPVKETIYSEAILTTNIDCTEQLTYLKTETDKQSGLID